jgi:hypothetical protein
MFNEMIFFHTDIAKQLQTEEKKGKQTGKNAASRILDSLHEYNTCSTIGKLVELAANNKENENKAI